MSNIEVVGLGALNIDNIFQVEGVLGDGETAVDREQVEPVLGYRDAELKWVDAFPGGSAANTIYGLAKLGVSTGFIGALGNDTEGRTLLRDFQKVGVDSTQIKIKPKAKTGLARCLSDKLNFRKISVSPGANSLLSMDDLDLDYVNRAGVLHISSFVADRQFKVLLELIDKLDESVKLSFSPGALYATKGIEVLTPILSKTHVLFINEKEIRQLTGQDFVGGARNCLERGCGIVVITLGEGATYKTVMATSYIRNSQHEYVVEPANKEIICTLDTIGAGDAFATGFIYGLLNGKGLEECGRLGDIVAQFSISKMGAREGLPTFNELAQRYKERYSGQL